MTKSKSWRENYPWWVQWPAPGVLTIKRMTETEWDGEKDVGSGNFVEFAWTSRLETVWRGEGRGEAWEEENGPIKHFGTLSNFRSGTNSWSTKKEGARNCCTEVNFAFLEVRWISQTDEIKSKGLRTPGMNFIFQSLGASICDLFVYWYRRRTLWEIEK